MLDVDSIRKSIRVKREISHKIEHFFIFLRSARNGAAVYPEHDMDSVKFFSD